MQAWHRRVIGTAVFAVFGAFLVSFVPLLRGQAFGLWETIWLLVGSALVGYSAWPAMELSWANRGERRAEERTAAIALGGGVGIVLAIALATWLGRGVGTSTLVVVAVLVALLLGTAWFSLVRIRRR